MYMWDIPLILKPYIYIYTYIYIYIEDARTHLFKGGLHIHLTGAAETKTRSSPSK